ncbi:MAG: prepilin-type N-terminal cleavage/methylation domain-containing protein [Desulfuromonadaceae bacterium]|nr:prepilin-type N-terminal cleavage/methylation domain-containing protein [Desulfuromonadaceae bacterium]MDD2846960.1 prepilin-type N-terminal cleavage/methylation domain-containing protein [Desulfuromonadaceae bacterium]MDD4129062.1 prepilin-type N-terminal cleavage/methylation domain-containing protein [Desulfuromonadaceae bacterium]
MFGVLKVCKGLSLIELIITITILGILAAGVIPMTRMTAQRTKEIELRRNLRTIRTAIDDYKRKFDKMPDGPLKTGFGYPKDLQELLDGRDFGDVKTGKIKFLRRKIYDPFHPPESENDDMWGWNLRSSVDKPDSTSWGKEDLFDVYSMSEGSALDGKTKYNEW